MNGSRKEKSGSRVRIPVEFITFTFTQITLCSIFSLPLYRLNNRADCFILRGGGKQSRRRITMNSKSSWKGLYCPRQTTAVTAVSTCDVTMTLTTWRDECDQTWRIPCIFFTELNVEIEVKSVIMELKCQICFVPLVVWFSAIQNTFPTFI